MSKETEQSEVQATAMSASIPMESSTDAAIESTSKSTPEVNNTSKSAVVESVPVLAGEKSKSFSDMLPEDLRNEANLKDFKDIGGLAKSYLSAQRMLGGAVKIPTPESAAEDKADFFNKIKDIDGVLVSPKTEEERQAFLTKLGRPEEASKYDFASLEREVNPATVPNVKEMLDEFKPAAFELGLTNDQATDLIKMKLKSEFAMQEQKAREAEATKEATISELKTLWGDNFKGKYQSAVSMANLMREQHPEAATALLTGPAGNNIALIQLLADMHKITQEKSHEGSQTSSVIPSAKKAIDIIEQLRGDSDFMKRLSDPRMPGHKEANERMASLYLAKQNG